MAAVAVI